MQATTCEWHLEDDEYAIWETSCGQSHSFIEGGIKENEYRFCPYCGGNIVELPADDDGNEA